MIENKDIKDVYADVGIFLERAVENASDIELAGEEENAELTAINSLLNSLNCDFKKEIERLEKSSEWDKFCIAFFGETNAGKSTIIESLRIIYNEESRREDYLNQIKQYKNAMEHHCDKYKDLIESLKEINNILEDKEKKPVKQIAICLICIGLGLVIGLLI